MLSKRGATYFRWLFAVPGNGRDQVIPTWIDGDKHEGEMTMETSRWRNRRGFLVSGATVAAAVAAVVAGLAAPALARPAAPAAITVRGPGYPPPGGIYKPFTNCPLNNPLMHEEETGSFGLAACVAGEATTGSVTLGKLITQVTEPVNVQFGFAGPPGVTNYPLPAYPPLAGTSAILSTRPDLIPESLTTALGCATATNATIQHMCQQAQSRGGRYNQVYALAEQAGQISNFSLFSWTQPVMFQLLNPLLGRSCSIGTESDPIVLNPALSLGPGGKGFFKNDPHPKLHPDTGVTELTGAVASDTTFSAPGVLGCGPGGVANDAVDVALDTSSGLPATSGNSLTLNGTFEVASNGTAADQNLPQPQDGAAGLLAAFRASSQGGGGDSVRRQITMSQFKSMFHDGG
jgi:hypothetical protein